MSGEWIRPHRLKSARSAERDARRGGAGAGRCCANELLHPRAGGRLRVRGGSWQRRVRSCSRPFVVLEPIRIEVAVGRHLLDKPALETPDLRLEAVRRLAAENPAVAVWHHQGEGLNEAAGAYLIHGERADRHRYAAALDGGLLGK